VATPASTGAPANADPIADAKINALFNLDERMESPSSTKMDVNVCLFKIK
jgi:hypothetical protein